MAKIGCLKPFRGLYDNIKDIVLEDGEIAFTTDQNNRKIYMGDGSSTIRNLLQICGNTGSGRYIQDCNDAIETGFYYCVVPCANVPENRQTYNGLIVSRYAAWDPTRIFQICTSINDGGYGSLWVRTKGYSGSTPDFTIWGSWNKLLDVNP